MCICDEWRGINGERQREIIEMTYNIHSKHIKIGKFVQVSFIFANMYLGCRVVDVNVVVVRRRRLRPHRMHPFIRPQHRKIIGHPSRHRRRSPFGRLLVTAQTERLHDPRVRFAALAELLQREPVVVVLVHLVEDLVDALLRRVLVLRLRLLALWGMQWMKGIWFQCGTLCQSLTSAVSKWSGPRCAMLVYTISNSLAAQWDI